MSGPAADVGEALRRAVRQYASGVAVLTVAHDGTLHGATVSAVTAVSRDPLLIAACLRTSSVNTELARAAGRFAVNVLSSRQAVVAGWFADPDRPLGPAQFACVRWAPDAASGAPVLAGSLARLSCRLSDCVPAGDHHILVAEVADGAVVAGGTPLLSYAGRLHDADLLTLPRRQPHPAVAAARRAAPVAAAVPAPRAAPATAGTPTGR
ncbi:MAG TPA: flavin reductase family protein [Pilimelia sp.]|nr:flavin reductase family protein [Pilimelia sp.]